MSSDWLGRLVRGRRRARVITLRDSASAEKFHVQVPMTVAGLRRGDATGCKVCGGSLEDVLITTGGANGDPNLWSERPVAVDGCRCKNCGQLHWPRVLDPREATELLNSGTAHVQEGRLDDAELALRRVCNSWPRYAPARVNLATLYLARLKAEEDGNARHLVMGRYFDTIESQLRDALGGDRVPRAMALRTLVRVLLAREAIGKALDVIEQERSRDQGEEDTRTYEELQQYVVSRGDLYERGIAALKHRIRLQDEPWTPLDERGRYRVQDGIGCLLRYQRTNPTNWQSLFVAGKGLQALGDHEGAARELARAFDIKPDQADVGREYALALIKLQQAVAAEPVARAACDLRPTDAGLVANLALVLLLAGKLEDAAATVERALILDPNDKITLTLARCITEVRRGQRAAPETLDDLDVSPKPRWTGKSGQ